jgi:hypothetical protein
LLLAPAEEKPSERKFDLLRQISPPEKSFAGRGLGARSAHVWIYLLKEEPMFDFIINRKNSVPRASLYCVWIRAHEGQNAPLIRVWIDPSMSIFDSQARVHEADLAAAVSEAQIALTNKRDA